MSQNYDFLAGKTVQQMWMWADTVRLVLDIDEVKGRPRSYVELNHAILKDAAGQDIDIQVGSKPAQAGPILRLLHQKVTGAREVDGALHLSFERGDAARSLPQQRYESWAVLDGGRMYQCLPGGEVESWPEAAE